MRFFGATQSEPRCGCVRTKADLHAKPSRLEKSQRRSGFGLQFAKAERTKYPEKATRPSVYGGRREGVLVHFEQDQFDALDTWIARQEPELSRPEAIRRLVELG
jgi:hypothetical protein